MKIALIIPSLKGGGAERVMTTLANAWANRDWDVTIITLDREGNEAYDLVAGVQRVGLNVLGESKGFFSAIRNNLRRRRLLRQCIKKISPDIIISFMSMTNVLAILAVRGLNIPTLVAEHISPQDDYLGSVWRTLRKHTYKKADRVVALTGRNAKWIRENIPGSVVTIIPNPVLCAESEDLDAIASSVLDRCGGKKILLAVGRLSPQKGFDLLLHSFSKIPVVDRQNWYLVIAGEGAERENLEAMAKDLEISDAVSLPGFTKTPHALMRRSDVFVLSSRYEGFPMVLLEAMCCGLPCISFDCRTGPAEIIENDVNGILTASGDVPMMAKALANVFRDDALRLRIGSRGKASATRFKLDEILKIWDKLFEVIKS